MTPWNIDMYTILSMDSVKKTVNKQLMWDDGKDGFRMNFYVISHKMKNVIEIIGKYFE